MDIKSCRLLAKYNQTANQKMNGVIRSLSEAQWNQAFPGFYKTIPQLCIHIYVSDFNWLKRFGQYREFAYFKDPLFGQTVTYDSNPFTGIADYIAKREQADAKLILLMDELTEGDMDGIITFVNPRGEKTSKNVGGSILHLFNHQTHHRGMISLLLDMLGKDNDFSSLLMMV